MRLLELSVVLVPFFFFCGGKSAVLPIVNSSAVDSSVNDSNIVTAQDLSSPYPYEFPQLGNVSDVDAQRFPMPACNGIVLEEATIDQLQEAMSTGRLTAVQIALCYLQRIYQTDSYIKWVRKKLWPPCSHGF